MHVLAISDTHLLDAARLPALLFPLLERADHVVHAGDVSALEVLRVLERYAPVTAVCGNVEQAEVEAALPVCAEVELAGVRLGVVHVGGATDGRHERLKRQFPGCGVVVYGHSHMPEAKRSGDVWIVNPGSPTQRRRAPFHSVAWIEIGDGGAVDVSIVDLGADDSS